MIRWIAGLMDRCFAVVGAIVFAQVPLFMQQYIQQLIGRTSELSLQVEGMRHAASLSGKTLEQLTKKFIESADLDVARQGELMLAIVKRWRNVSDALSAMKNSSVWSRPFAFLYHLDTDAFSSSFDHFKIGLPLNLEGGVYALAGVAAGYLVFAFLRKCLCFLRDPTAHAGIKQIRRSLSIEKFPR